MLIPIKVADRECSQCKAVIERGTQAWVSRDQTNHQRFLCKRCHSPRTLRPWVKVTLSVTGFLLFWRFFKGEIRSVILTVIFSLLLLFGGVVWIYYFFTGYLIHP